MSTIAASIIWNSVRLPETKLQIRMPGTAMRKVPNSNLPISGSARMYATIDPAPAVDSALFIRLTNSR